MGNAEGTNEIEPIELKYLDNVITQIKKSIGKTYYILNWSVRR